MENIILYTIHCRLCKKLKEELDKNFKTYTIIDDVDTLKSLGFENMPMLSVNGSCLNFQKAIMWLRGVNNAD